jgi:hypothetical protein
MYFVFSVEIYMSVSVYSKIKQRIFFGHRRQNFIGKQFYFTSLKSYIYRFLYQSHNQAYSLERYTKENSVPCPSSPVAKLHGSD